MIHQSEDRARQGDRSQAVAPVAVPIISRRVLALSLVTIAMLAAAPFVIANVVSERRISEAQGTADDIAAALREAGGASVSDAQVLIGSGTPPQAGDASRWLTGTSADLGEGLRQGPEGASPDPWRNAYLVNIGASGPVWVISAGPNGILETPFDDASAPAGDDVGARVR